MSHDSFLDRKKNALFSVSNTTGLKGLAQSLITSGFKIFATKGTMRYLSEEGIECQSVETYLQAEERFSGRIKTLHPKLYSGILPDLHNEDHLAAWQSEPGLLFFSVVVVNLYPFEDEVIKKKESLASWQDGVAWIDIGGPSMIRAAAKNFASCWILSDPSDYAQLPKDMTDPQSRDTLPLRAALARSALLRTQMYDQMISDFFVENTLPSSQLTYGENPHQKAQWQDTADRPWFHREQGPQLSFNNLKDVIACGKILRDLEALPAAMIIKHNNPCGLYVPSACLVITPREILFRAIHCDPLSAFGGVIALNQPCDEDTAELIREGFYEVVLAPSFTQGAKDILAKKPKLKLLRFDPAALKAAGSKQEVLDLDIRLSQSRDDALFDPPTQLLQSLTPPHAEMLMHDIRVAELAAKHLTSNAISLSAGGRVMALACGQQSRVDSVKIAIQKWHHFNEQNLDWMTQHPYLVCGSDAFFPFRDSIDRLAEISVKVLVQPGGSIRDKEVDAACQQHGIIHVTTGLRHFKHF